MEKILVSACLIGRSCKYNGGNNLSSIVEKLQKKYEFVLICPEVDGGLPIPRNPSERRGHQVVSNQGEDVTMEFTKGASIALDIAKRENIHIAILKESSPSCGSTNIYDGTFTGTKIPGKGITAELLEAHGIKIYSEKNCNELL